MIEKYNFLLQITPIVAGNDNTLRVDSDMQCRYLKKLSGSPLIL